MPTIIKCKIDVAKIHGAKLLRKDGRTFLELSACQLYEGKTGALYLDFALFPTPDSQYGDDYRITQDMPKALRDAGVRGPIIGNAKNKEIGGYGAPAPRPQPETSTAFFGGTPGQLSAKPSAEEDCPF